MPRRSPFSCVPFMTGRWPPAGILVLAAYLALCALTVRSAQAQDTGDASRAVEGPRHFSLPAQPLALALQTLGRMTDLSVLVGSDLLDGRVSASLEGDYSPRDALQRLLNGTGLRASFVGENSVVLLPAPPSPEPAPSLPDPHSAPPVAGTQEKDNDALSYAGMIQIRLAEALCRSAQTRPGSYRLLMQFHIDASGAIVSPQLLESTGMPARDAAIGEAMRGLMLDSAPPAGLRQPVTILLREQDGSADCRAAEEQDEQDEQDEQGEQHGR